MGSVSGGGSYLVGDIISISATANNGYHFVKWSDNNTQNPRTITVNENTTTYTAVFAIDTTPVDNTIYYFASENDDYSPIGKTVKTLGNNNTTEQLNNVDTLVFLIPTTITILKIEDAQMGTDFLNKFQTHAVTYNSQEYTAYYYTDPDAYINGQFIVRY